MARLAERPIEVGWLLDTRQPSFLFQGPRRVRGLDWRPGPAEGGFDRAPVDEEWHLFEVPCPYNLRLKPVQDAQGKIGLVNALKGPDTISPRRIGQIAVPVERELWRDPRRPLVQVATPFRFVADEPLWITQLPPFNAPHQRAWPGAFIAGRFPLHIWPRAISWAFEWHDPSRELVLEAGAPWFYIKLESREPMRRIAFVEARMTPSLRKFCSGLDGVVHYVNRTFSLFEVAKRRRPETLLTRAGAETPGDERSHAGR